MALQDTVRDTLEKSSGLEGIYRTNSSKTMGDKFQRQVSHRWVKAETPSYGDDWGENESDTEDSCTPSTVANPSEPPLLSDVKLGATNTTTNTGDHTATYEELSITQPQSTQITGPPQKAAPNLVLSIDTLVRREFDESSDDEALSEIHRGETSREGGDPSTQILLRNMVQPPLAPFSPAMETPTSDRSFMSDAESIQIEPESLRLFDHAHKPSPDPIHEKHELIRPVEEYQSKPVLATIDPNARGDDTDYDLDSLASDGQKQGSSTSISSPSQPNLPPLVISIDKKSTQYDSDNSEDSETLPDPPSKMHNSIDDYQKKSLQGVDEPRDSDDDWGSDSEDEPTDLAPKSIYGSKPGSIKSDAHYRETEYVNAPPHAIFPDLSQRLYDDAELTGNIVAQKYGDLGVPSSSPRAGINMPIEDSSLECLPLNLSETPTGLSFSTIKPSNANPDVGHTRSVRKPPSARADLVSVDYSNIADAMDGYLDGHALAKGAHEEHLNSAFSNIASGIPESLEHNMKDPLAGFSKPMIPGLVDRRASTQSTKTFTLGNWTPNTGQFRDQFIREDDMESTFSFAPEDEKNSHLRAEFVKKVGGHDANSTRSSFSLNETTDGDYPHSKAATADSKDMVTQFASTSTENESVFQNHPHLTPLFLEERSTPDPSTEALDRDLTQKYSSLIPPLTLNNGVDKPKNTLTNELHPIVPILEESDQANRSNPVKDEGDTQSPIPQKKLYDWKKIQTASQPVDRIRMLKDALKAEQEHDTGLRSWLDATLKPSEEGPSIHIGKIALEAYQNAAHRDIRRHVLIRSTVHNVKDKVETGGLQATSLGKRLISRGRKLMSGGSTE